ncbi:MAG: hypothetical protein ACXWYQ_06845 [Actinomycetota bacterium]
MADVSRWRRLLEPVLTIGEYLGEPETRRSGRRVFLVAFVIATVFTIPSSVMDLAAGYTTVGVMNLVSAGLSFVFLLAMKIWPLRFGALVNGMFVLILLTQLAETAMFGGLLPSGLVVIFGLALGLAAMIAIGLRAAIWWTVAFSASVVLRAPTRPVSAPVRRPAPRDPARRDRATTQGGAGRVPAPCRQRPLQDPAPLHHALNRRRRAWVRSLRPRRCPRPGLRART